MKPAIAIILANLKSNIGDFAILHAILLDLQQNYPGRAVHVLPLGHYQIDEGRIAAFRALMTTCETEDSFHFKSVSREFGIDYIALRLGRKLLPRLKRVVANRKKAKSFVADSRLPISVQRVSDLTPDLLARCLSERQLLLDKQRVTTILSDRGFVAPCRCITI